MQQVFKESYLVDFRKNPELKSHIKNKTVLLFQPYFPCYIMDGTNATIFFPLQVQCNTGYPGQRPQQRWFPGSLKQHIGRLGKFEWHSLAYLPKEIKFFAIVMPSLTTWLLFNQPKKNGKKNLREQWCSCTFHYSWTTKTVSLLKEKLWLKFNC